MRYADPSGSTDHVVSNVRFTKADGWVHYSGTATIKGTSADRSADQFAVFANPYGEYGVNYQIDNISFKEVN